MQNDLLVLFADAGGNFVKKDINTDLDKYGHTKNKIKNKNYKTNNANNKLFNDPSAKKRWQVGES